MPGQRNSKDFKRRAIGAMLTRGTNKASKLAARSKRDRPGIAEAVECGEYGSIRQAAIAAGTLKAPETLNSAPKTVAKISDGALSVVCAQFMDEF